MLKKRRAYHTSERPNPGNACARCGFSIVGEPQVKMGKKFYCRTCSIIMKSNYAEALMENEGAGPADAAMKQAAEMAAGEAGAIAGGFIPVPGGALIGRAVGIGALKAGEAIGEMMKEKPKETAAPKEAPKEAPKTNPHGRAITLKQAKALKYGDRIYHRRLKNRDGSPMRFKVNGKPRTWKTRPDEVVVPLKHGMFQYLSIHEGELKDFTLGSKDNPIPGPARDGAERYLEREKRFVKVKKLLEFAIRNECGRKANQGLTAWNKAMDSLDALTKKEQSAFKKTYPKLWEKCFGG
mgnify:CR=1 FL=1